MANKINFETMNANVRTHLATVDVSKDKKAVDAALFELFATNDERLELGKRNAKRPAGKAPYIGTAKIMPTAFMDWMDGKHSDASYGILVDAVKDVLASWGVSNLNDRSTQRFIRDVLVSGSLTSNAKGGGVKTKSSRAFEKALVKAFVTIAAKYDAK